MAKPVPIPAPLRDELLERARAPAPAFRERAEQAEKFRSAPDETTTDFVKVMRWMAPTRRHREVPA